MLHLPTAQYELIVAQGLAGKPLEVCGLLVGTKASGDPDAATYVVEAHPVESEDPSELVYTLNALEYLRISRNARLRGLDVVGIYHTHPATEPYPSPTDVARAHWGDSDDLNYPGYSYLIVSLRNPFDPEPRSFKINGRSIPGDILEEPVVIG